MARDALIAGNWKLNKDHQEAIHLVRDLGLRLANLNLSRVEVAIHPPFTDLRSVEAVVEGLPWRQPPFPYQAKCLQWLRASHGALSGASRAQVDALMAASGCAAMFA